MKWHFSPVPDAGFALTLADVPGLRLNVEDFAVRIHAQPFKAVGAGCWKVGWATARFLVVCFPLRAGWRVTVHPGLGNVSMQVRL